MLGKLRYVEIEAKVERATVVGARFERLRLRQSERKHLPYACNSSRVKIFRIRATSYAPSLPSAPLASARQKRPKLLQKPGERRLVFQDQVVAARQGNKPGARDSGGESPALIETSRGRDRELPLTPTF